MGQSRRKWGKAGESGARQEKVGQGRRKWGKAGETKCFTATNNVVQAVQTRVKIQREIVIFEQSRTRHISRERERSKGLSVQGFPFIEFSRNPHRENI